MDKTILETSEHLHKGINPESAEAGQLSGADLHVETGTEDEITLSNKSEEAKLSPVTGAGELELHSGPKSELVSGILEARANSKEQEAKGEVSKFLGYIQGVEDINDPSAVIEALNQNDPKAATAEIK